MSLDVYLTEDVCPTCGRGERVYDAHITHNLASMASEACIYEIVWRPERHGITTAGQLIEPLTKAIAKMDADPERFRELDPANGWGSYDMFLPWLLRYRTACIEFPRARVSVWR